MAASGRRAGSHVVNKPAVTYHGISTRLAPLTSDGPAGKTAACPPGYYAFALSA